MSDPYNLERFLKAQAGTYQDALNELRAGQKRGHWMWFIFPQLRGLGHSQTAFFYGLGSRAEAEAYWQHGVLAARLTACTESVLRLSGKTSLEIFGSPDDLKFRSSLTLFAEVAPAEPTFARALAKFCAGVPDEKTLELLGGSSKR